MLIAPAVNGQPEPDTLDEDSMRIIEPLMAAGDAGDVDAQLRLHAHLWLDGPASEEGRVGGAARELALAMNEVIVRDDVPDEEGEAGVDAWARLGEIDLPTTVMWGDRDVPFGIETCEAIAGRIPGARTFVLAGLAHLPSLEDPARSRPRSRRARRAADGRRGPGASRRGSGRQPIAWPRGPLGTMWVVAYRELAPPPDLAHIVRCLWVRTGTGAPSLVLPDGCLDVIVRDGAGAVAGPDTRPVETTVPQGSTIAGVRFHPGAAAAALGVPADELRDLRVPLDALWRRDEAAAVAEAAGDPWIAGRGPAAPAARRRARPAHAGGGTPPRARPGDPGSGARGRARARRAPAPAPLRRRRRVRPETFARVERFRAALALVRAGEPLARAAAEAG